MVNSLKSLPPDAHHTHSTDAQLNAPFAAYHFAELDSTQRFIKEHAALPYPLLCRADAQSAGVGQRQQVWHSPKGQLYFSYRCLLQTPVYAQQGLTQYLALTLAHTLDPNAEYLRLKWPNDLYIQGKKVAGILVETAAQGDATQLYIGIGINVKAPSHQPSSNEKIADRFATSIGYLSDDLLKSDWRCEADTLYPVIIKAVKQALIYWQSCPYLPYTHRWKAYDLYHNQTVKLEYVQSSTQHITGTLLGIDHKGRLMVKHQHQLLFLTHTRILSAPTS